MAITRFHNGFRMTAAGDVVAGLFKVTTITCVLDGTNVGQFDFRDSALVIFLQVRLEGTTANGGRTFEPVPINTWLDGIEIDALPTGAKVTVHYE